MKSSEETADDSPTAIPKKTVFTDASAGKTCPVVVDDSLTVVAGPTPKGKGKVKPGEKTADDGPTTNPKKPKIPTAKRLTKPCIAHPAKAKKSANAEIAKNAASRLLPRKAARNMAVGRKATAKAAKITDPGATQYTATPKRKGLKAKAKKLPINSTPVEPSTINVLPAISIEMTDVSLEATALETPGDITQVLHETPESRLSVSELVVMFGKTSRVVRSVSADPDTRVGRDTGSTPTAESFLTEEKRQELNKRASLLEHRLNIVQGRKDLPTMSNMVSPPRTPEPKEDSLTGPKENLREISLQQTSEEDVENLNG